MDDRRNTELENTSDEPSLLNSTVPTQKRRFQIAEYNRLQKCRREELLNSRVEKKAELKTVSKEVHKLQQRIYRQTNKVSQLENAIQAMGNNSSTENVAPQRKPKIASEVSEGNTDKLKLSKAQFHRRKKKTLDQLKTIHSNDSPQGKKPVLDALWSTLISTASKEDMIKYVSNSKISMDSVLPAILNKKAKEYEQSEENKVRSARYLYDGNLISKRKYTRLRLCTYQRKDPESVRGIRRPSEFMKGCPLPNILPYKTLMKFINSIDIGDKRELEEFAKEVNKLPVPGVYRPLEPLLIQLANFYLLVDKTVQSLHWFHGEGVFYVAVGGDGAPFGKDDTATAYLVSFANLLHRVASCDDNHLLLGANCEEDHPLMIAFTSHLNEEMERMEKEEYISVTGQKIKFKFELFPADMKWASKMCGELNNNATYFSPFANVSQDDKATIGASINDKPGSAKWSPWRYEKRVKVANQVEEFKKKLPNKGNGKDRSKVTAYIARQEFDPSLGKFADKIKTEPLHDTNNAWQQWFLILLTVAMALTEQKCLKAVTSISDLPKSAALSLFLTCLKDTIKCARLHKNICNWFVEKRKKNLKFSYRFTGKESKLMSLHFSNLIGVLLKHVAVIERSIKLRLHVLAFVGLQLTDSCALYNAVNITEENVRDLETKCKEYFNASLLFCGKESITPTVWTIGYVVPFHTRKMYSALGYGLGLNTMQGREAKHIKLAKYMENTSNVRKSQRWWTVFRHEYVSLVWLRQKDPANNSYRDTAAKQKDFIQNSEFPDVFRPMIRNIATVD